MTKQFVLPINLYSDDIDYYGVVYHANYLRYFERCRNHWLASFGGTLDYVRDNGILFAIFEANLRYLHPAKMGDNLEVTAKVSLAKRVRVVFEQTVRSADDHNVIYCQGNITVVCLDQNQRPTAWPQEFIKEMVDVD